MGKEKVHINIVVVGHVGSGKSTIVDHLIDKLGGIDIDRFDKEAAEINKLSFKYGWMLDKLKAQRERGITTLCMFETTKYYCTVIDATRHTDFYENNMTQADCAVLVIDSTTSRFETGLSEDDNRTLGIALHASVFGMDATTPKYSSDRFKEIGKNFSPYLMRFGYNPSLIPFVPISGIEGDNLIEPSTNVGWYNGPTLVETLDLIKPTRPSIKPMMIKDPCAADRYLSIGRQLQLETRMLKEEFKHLSSAGQNVLLDMSAKLLDSVKEECKCVCTEGETFRQHMLAKFQELIKGSMSVSWW